MKLEYNVFPNFYQKYDWVMEEEEDKLFTGRKYYLENFWRNLSNVANHDYSRQNKAFIGQRKMGKTAFLVRCYNLAFWEQDEVVPFYYCFPQTEKLNLRETTEEIAFKFLQQAISFVTKNREYSEINSANLIFHKLRKSNFAWFEDFHFYWEECQEDIKTSSGRKLLEIVWNLTKSFSGLFGKKCLLIIDEYQKTVCNLIDEEGHSVVCHESIGKIINDRNIYTIISGSQISMIAYDVLTPELYNRIPGEKFDPLMEEEAHQLIREYAGKKSYKGIEKDVHELTGGNPYYIKILFMPTNKFYKYFKRDKKWESKKDIEELYNFEMLHPEGEVFQFWRNHINDKLHLLNDDPPKHKGATIRLLKYIAERDGYVHIIELQEKFPEIKDMRARLRKLRDTDLILDTVDSEQILNFSDHVLPVVMTKMYQKIFLGSLSAEAFNKYKEEWFKTLAERISKRFDGIDEHIGEIEESAQKHETAEEQIKLLSSKIKVTRSNKGKANLAKGIKAQSKAAKAIEALFDKQQTIFSKDYDLKQPLISTNVKLASGRGNEVDFYGVLCAKNGTKPKECAIIGEVKHYKRGKIRKDAAQKFVDSIGLVKRDGKQKEAIAMFISSSGFNEDAIKILEKYDVVYGDLEQTLNKIKMA